MNTVINILSKNPDQTDCKTRLKALLSKVIDLLSQK